MRDGELKMEISWEWLIEAERERDTDEDEIIWKVNKKYSYSIDVRKKKRENKWLSLKVHGIRKNDTEEREWSK